MHGPFSLGGKGVVCKAVSASNDWRKQQTSQVLAGRLLGRCCGHRLGGGSVSLA